MSDLATYYFVPAIREGLASCITAETPAGFRATIDARLITEIANESNPPLVSKIVGLYGPGDVVGLDARVVTRTDPRHNVWDYEPNYMPLVEFGEPDLPWRFTPSVATDPSRTGVLKPWITLVVLKEGEFEGLDVIRPPENQKSAVPIHWIKQAAISALPDLTRCWMWAHTQVTAQDELDTTRLRECVSDKGTEGESQVVSRLICPRRLAPRTKYTAFIVPTFKAGQVAVGLIPQLESDENALTLGWIRPRQPQQPPPKVDLPYYYKWEFGTGVRSDFEYLVNLLEPRPLSHLGKRPMDCSSMPYQIPACPSLPSDAETTTPADGAATPPADADATPPDDHVLQLEGALMSPQMPSTRYTGSNEPLAGLIAGFQSALAGVLNQPATNVDSPSRDAWGPPVVPPVYGRWHSGQPEVDPTATVHWQHDTNLDPRLRAAAGFGASVIEKEQEPLMASVWDQLGDIEHANAMLRPAELGLEASRGVYARLGKLPQADFLWISAPVFGRVRAQLYATAPPVTISQYLSTSPIPAAAFDPAFRRMLRRRGGIRKLQGGAFKPEEGQDLISRLNDGDIAAGGPPPHLVGMPSMCDITDAAERTLREKVEASKVPASIVRIDGYVIENRTGHRVPGVHVQIWTRGRRTAKGVPTEMLARGATNKRGAFRFDIKRSQIAQWLPDDRPVIYVKVFNSSGGTPFRAVRHTFLRQAKQTFTILVQASGPGGRPPAALARTNDFCEEAITCDAVVKAVKKLGEKYGLHAEAGKALCEGLDQWLNPPHRTLARRTADLNAVYRVVKTAVDPRTTIPARIAKRLRLGPGVHQRGVLGRVESEIDFPQPMYEPLAAISQDLVLPSVETVPDNTISILKANRRFIEAYMLGLNHSLAGEVLWRGAPVYLWTTFFRQFWDVRGYVDPAADPEQSKDIMRLTTWTPESPLGQHDPRGSLTVDGQPAERAVLLLRGQLLKRYPNTLVYAVPSVNNAPVLDDTQREWPIFSGSLPPDLTFLGFNKTPVELCTGGDGREGYYVVIEERLGEPRFGFDLLDEGETSPSELLGEKWWFDMTWEHFQPAVAENDYIDDSNLGTDAPPSPVWGESAATVANICMQRPVRVSIHASRMLSALACSASASDV